MLKLKEYRTRAKGLPDLLPYAALVEPDIVLCKDGTLLAAYEIRGADTESCTDDELAYVSHRVNAAFKRMGSGWMLHVDAVRLPAPGYFAAEDCHFPDRVSRMLDEARRKTFASGQYFTTSTYMSLCWKPSEADSKLKSLAVKKGIEEEKNFLESSLASFKKSLLGIEDGLFGSLALDRLGCGKPKNGGAVYSPLLAYLQLCITGEDYIPRVPHTPMYLDAIVGGRDLVGGIEPRIGRQHIAVVAIDGLPSESWPAMLSSMGAFPFAGRFSTRFICLDKHQSMKEVDKYRKTWAQNIYKFFDKIFNKINPRADKDALSMAQDAEAAYTALQSDFVGAGYYTANIVLLDEDIELLREKVRQIQRELMRLGFGCRIEEINALEAWLSTHPGNFWANVRRPLISTLNLADFLPLASVWSGRKTNPCDKYPPNSPALIQCATSSTIPFWLNLHVSDLGHTVIVGPSGAGKSTLLALIALQFLKYPQARVIAFDKGMSLYPLCKAVGGMHYNIGGDDSPSFAPFSDINKSKAELRWAKEWCAQLCALQGLEVLPAHQVAINDAVNGICNMQADKRWLSTVQQRVQNADVKQALLHYTLAGAMGNLLDARENTITDSIFTVYEIEHLMNMREDKNILPVLFYLFHTIDNLLSQNLAPFILLIDEAWVMLRNPYFSVKILELLKVARKKNCAVVMATQNITDVSKSEIFDAIIGNCSTQIYLPNDKAGDPASRPVYELLGLNEREIDMITRARSKREYYVTSSEGRRLVNLALSPAELAFVGASSKEDIARIQTLEAQHGTAWVDHWLEERGVKTA